MVWFGLALWGCGLIWAGLVSPRSVTFLRVFVDLSWPRLALWRVAGFCKILLDLGISGVVSWRLLVFTHFTRFWPAHANRAVAFIALC